MSYNHLFKIVVVGDHNCGKSCMLLRFAENTFRMDHLSTIGVDFKLKTIKLGRDKVSPDSLSFGWNCGTRLEWKDIGQFITRIIILLMASCVYDMTNEKSFSSLESYWLKQIKEHAPQNSVLMLVGNKTDLGDERKVSSMLLLIVTLLRNLFHLTIMSFSFLEVFEGFTAFFRRIRRPV
ncbi:Ras family protein [Necator americanus]|uniref:Ras family protein n=1 Tax=Necator americanus TaxID=51031 RepID=W2ST70_NECAM|nr:Ras family protein [Necator americanus]ETN72051.1 Ras family protein [Necator americanus]